MVATRLAVRSERGRCYEMAVGTGGSVIDCVLDTVLRGDDAVGCEENRRAIGVLGDGGGAALAVEGNDGVLGREGAAEVKGDEGPDSTEAHDVYAHRRSKTVARVADAGGQGGRRQTCARPPGGVRGARGNWPGDAAKPQSGKCSRKGSTPTNGRRRG